MTDCWSILGIAPTTNKRDIKVAYTERLKQSRPDRDPEGFKVLRKALNEALQSSRFVTDLPQPATSDVPVENEAAAQKGIEQSVEFETDRIDSIPALKQALSRLYHDPEKRARQEGWVALLDSPVAENLDLVRECEDTVIPFFCAHNLLPFEVLEIFVQRFGFVEEFTRFESRDYFPQARYLYYLISTRMSRPDYPGDTELPADILAQLRMLENRRTIEDAAIFERMGPAALVDLYGRQAPAPFDAGLVLYLAQHCLREGAYDLVFSLLDEQAVKRLGHRAYPPLAESHYRQGQYELALHWYQQHASACEPEVPEATNKGIALSLAELEQDEAALVLLQQYSEKCPHDFEARLKLSQVRKRLIDTLQQDQEGQKRLELAELLYDARQFRDCIALLEPQKYYLRNNSNTLLARCCARLGDYVEAGNEFWEIIQGARIRNENILDLMAEYILFCNHDLGPNQFQKIVQPEMSRLTEAARTNGEYAYVAALVYRRAQTILDMDDAKRENCRTNAARYIDLATELAPEKAEYHFLRANIMYDIGNHEQTIVSGKIARSINYTHYLINFNLGFAYHATRQYALAVKQLKFTLGLNPPPREAHGLASYLIHSLIELDDMPQALSWVPELCASEHADLGWLFGHLVTMYDNIEAGPPELTLDIPGGLLALLKPNLGFTKTQREDIAGIFVTAIGKLDERYAEQGEALRTQYQDQYGTLHVYENIGRSLFARLKRLAFRKPDENGQKRNNAHE